MKCLNVLVHPNHLCRLWQKAKLCANGQPTTDHFSFGSINHRQWSVGFLINKSSSRKINISLETTAIGLTESEWKKGMQLEMNVAFHGLSRNGIKTKLF